MLIESRDQRLDCQALLLKQLRDLLEAELEYSPPDGASSRASQICLSGGVRNSEDGLSYVFSEI